MTDAAAEEPSQSSWLALAALLGGACIIGLAAILVRMSDAGPAATGVWRLIFAMPLLALMTWRTAGSIGGPPRMALWAGLFFALDLGFWHYGIQYTSVANATVLTNLTPVVVTAFAWIFLRQRPRALFLVAVAAAVGGASLMAYAKGGGALRNQPLGDALSVATAFWYALYFLTMAEGRRTEGASRMMFWAGVAGLPLLLGAALLLGEPLTPASATGWAACAGLGLMHVAGQGSIAWAMGRLPTSTASVVVLVQPVVAAWLGWLLFAEAIGPLQALGAAVTLGGVVLAQWVSRKKAG
ncbi:MAG: DMT family transporter [Phenylobacterium sp.]|uniref:DMT family transporter n=1 Tax=Phenylobacterium sp. TaxID=1871053 RepID=UPI001225CC51|nr:DMT family transporter [Phenylobacterium sp.]TAJ72381.1 MAG: DMT family transporter [Phenylobacterium sp.]